MAEFTLRLHHAAGILAETACLSLVLEKEAYTPYEQLTAVFRTEDPFTEQITQLSLLRHTHEVFLGLPDLVEQTRRSGTWLVRIRSRSFTSLLTQNELAPGLHTDLTMQKLLTEFWTFPHISCESPQGTGYIFVRPGSTMWDGVVNFGYKLTQHYPYVRKNCILLSPPSGFQSVAPDPAKVLALGRCQDTSAVVSHFHMEDLLENPDVYTLENPDAVRAGIVRHRRLAFDRQYLYAPDDALQFRRRFSMRRNQSEFVEYCGCADESVGDTATLPGFWQNAVICRVRIVYSSGGGLRTRLWSYHDGFYPDTGAV